MPRHTPLHAVRRLIIGFLQKINKKRNNVSPLFASFSINLVQIILQNLYVGLQYQPKINYHALWKRYLNSKSQVHIR